MHYASARGGVAAGALAWQRYEHAAGGTGGSRSLGVVTGRSSAGELRAAGADMVLDDLADTAAVDDLNAR